MFLAKSGNLFLYNVPHNSSINPAENKISFIKTQFVPEVLLTDGTEFEIVDNGKVIGTGAFKWDITK